MSFRLRLRTIRNSVHFRAGLQLTAVLGLLILLAFRDPNTVGSYPTCPFRLISGGLLCPGCGSMRMVHAVLHGHFLLAFRLNPLSFAFLPLVGWLVADLFTALLMGQHLPRFRPQPRTIWLLIIVIAVYTISRNLFPWLTTA